MPTTPSSTGATSAEGSRPRSKRGAGADVEATRRALVDAALATLREAGYAGASARAVAGRAGCNQASIYYHFGGVSELLVAALVESSTQRFERYRAVIDPIDDLGELLDAWRRLHQEDVDSGHITALTELVGALGAAPALTDGVREISAMWTDFIEATIRRVLADSPLADAVPVEEAASVVFALFLGVELVTHIDGDTERPDRLFRAGAQLAGVLPYLGMLTSAAQTPDGTARS